MSCAACVYRPGARHIPSRWRNRQSMSIASASRTAPALAGHRGRDDAPWIGAWTLMLGNLYAGPYYAELFDRHGLLRDEVAAITCIRMAGCVTSQDIVNFTGRPK